MITREEVGRRIRRAREELGLSQGDLGRLLSRPRTYAAISDIERGKTKLDVEELAEIARILQKDVPYFLGTPSVVYRRGDRGLTSEEQRHTNRSIEDFKRYAREMARKRQEQDG
ncbi:helix-turn-helix domain-containing protein [Nitrolancea hollandica]|uniref:HTH cro/C1-type domain-containing protein n=1 Tax=Nitrolancea hollandica Lb TaxID=1129897 RepID=I4EKU9_9BACT|nr:helix-turn-helix transcriptional regulator [Nitrolancea hollandica]CCF85311.1 hypothetical protein NITHO_480009 [Nitrolancea hollandica Lb]